MPFKYSLALCYTMEWINKAKATLAELEKDLNKATEALSMNNHGEDTRSESGISTPVVYTPTSSAAPSVISTGGQSVKVPIAARKSGKSLLLKLLFPVLQVY